MKKLLIAFGLIVISASAANAFVDTGYMSTKQYMLNSGYSANMAKYAEISTRDPYAPTDDKYPVRNTKYFLKVLWKKIDATAFEDDNNTWHDIKMTTGFKDLN